MSESYRGLAVFVAVADAGSFSAAGRRLKLSTSVVSHHISKLEATLGTPLFFRSTRSLSLTSEGHKILESARRMVAAGEEALDALSDQGDQPVGALRITLPAFGLSSSIHQSVWSFAKAHPMVALSLHSSDSPVDLVREGYDLAIRLGVLSDSALKSRRISTFERRLVASPDYLSNQTPIRRIDDLVECEFVMLSMLPSTFVLMRDREEITVTAENVRIQVDSVIAGKAAVLSGLGLQVLPMNEIEDELASGELVEVLPQWKPPARGVYAVWPDSGPQKKLTRRLIDHLVNQQAQHLH